MHSLFGEHFSKTGLLDRKFHRWLMRAFSARLVGDYGIASEFTAEEVQPTIDQAREFLQTATGFLES